MSAFLATADDKGDKDKHVTGCLAKNVNGSYELTEKHGTKLTVMGSADLEKHAANHKVVLHGTRKTVDGQPAFQVERVEHVSDTCDWK